MRAKRTLALCIVLMLSMALCAAEVVARDRVRVMVTDSARRVLNTAALAVDIGSSPMLINLVSDQISAISIVAKNASFCRLSGIDVSAVLHDVSVSRGPTVSHTDVVITMNPTAIQHALAEATRTDPATVSVATDDGLIHLHTGPSGKLTVDIAPEIDGSDLVFMPRSMALDGHPLDPQVVSALDRSNRVQRRRSLAGLPLGLVATSVKVTNSALMLYLTGGAAPLKVDASRPCGDR
ncbi:hypothetical protein A5641_10330 [Mycobacterium sp. 1554424.7]|nr:hypothetical protein A5641_10330 [Mycobacterium sp. 1554424.7]